MKRARRPAKPHAAKIAASPAAPAVAVNEAGVALPFRHWLLAGMTALFVARPLVPSEGVAWVGDGQTFCMQWLVLATLTCIAAVKGGGLLRRFEWLDALLAAFVVLYAAAALRGASIGSPRPAINMLWEVVAMALAFLLVRQLVRTRLEARMLIAAMIALAVVLSVDGLYQVVVSMPADRAEFARDPDGMLRRAGEWYPPGSPERAAFENRLGSTEPLATFALTNSLAGFLLPWMTVAAGVALGTGAGFQRVAFAAATSLLGFCLLLTKSRSGYVAMAVAMALLLCNRFRHVWRSKAPWMIFAAISMVVAVAFFTGLIDREVVTEAGKSLGYRLQYWQSSVAMIQNRPLLGVGPGNFQDTYTAYKLPQASEEIRDPHNWLLEIAATAGIPAAVLLAALAIGALVRLAGRAGAESASPEGDAREKAFPAKPTSDLAAGSLYNASRARGCIATGAACGFLLAYSVGRLVGLSFGMERLVVGLIVGAIVLWPLRRWVESGTLTPRLLAVAVVALLVHLLASGGILFPGVAGSLWLLLGVGLNLAEPQPTPSHRIVPLLALVACAALTVAQYLTGYAPVLRSQGALLEADYLRDNLKLKEEALLRAAEADPRSADPWQELAIVRLQRWLAKPGPRLLDQFRQATERFLALKPHSSSGHRLVGNGWTQIYERSGKPEDARSAVAALAQAVSLYPTSAILHAELATALVAAHRPGMAANEARAALQLDGATPHKDKQLPDAVRDRMQQLAP